MYGGFIGGISIGGQLLKVLIHRKNFIFIVVSIGAK